MSIHRAARLAAACITRVPEAASDQLRSPECATTQAISRPPGSGCSKYGVIRYEKSSGWSAGVAEKDVVVERNHEG